MYSMWNKQLRFIRDLQLFVSFSNKPANKIL